MTNEKDGNEERHTNPLTVLAFVLAPYFSLYLIFEIDFVFFGQRFINGLPGPVEHVVRRILGPVLRWELIVDNWLNSL